MHPPAGFQQVELQCMKQQANVYLILDVIVFYKNYASRDPRATHSHHYGHQAT